MYYSLSLHDALPIWIGDGSSGSKRCDLIAKCALQHELGGVQDLDCQAAADLHLIFFEHRVRSEPRRGGPVADGIRSVLLNQAHGRYDVALRLRHLFPVLVQHPTAARRVLLREVTVVPLAPRLA